MLRETAPIQRTARKSMPPRRKIKLGNDSEVGTNVKIRSPHVRTAAILKIVLLAHASSDVRYWG